MGSEIVIKNGLSLSVWFAMGCPKPSVAICVVRFQPSFFASVVLAFAD